MICSCDIAPAFWLPSRNDRDRTRFFKERSLVRDVRNRRLKEAVEKARPVYLFADGAAAGVVRTDEEAAANSARPRQDENLFHHDTAGTHSLSVADEMQTDIIGDIRSPARGSRWWLWRDVLPATGRREMIRDHLMTWDPGVHGRRHLDVLAGRVGRLLLAWQNWNGTVCAGTSAPFPVAGQIGFWRCRALAEEPSSDLTPRLSDARTQTQHSVQRTK